jgi:hypothetical protein
MAKGEQTDQSAGQYGDNLRLLKLSVLSMVNMIPKEAERNRLKKWRENYERQRMRERATEERCTVQALKPAIRTEVIEESYIELLGQVNDRWDEIYHWYRKRGIIVAGWFGDRGMMFYPISVLPKDGVYVNKDTGEEVVIGLQELFTRRLVDASDSKVEDEVQDGVEYQEGLVEEVENGANAR